MTEADWGETSRSLMVFLNGETIPEPDARGGRIVDDSLLVLLNGDAESVRFRLPRERFGTGWHVVLDTSRELANQPPKAAKDAILLEGRSVVVLVRPPTVIHPTDGPQTQVEQPT